MAPFDVQVSRMRFGRAGRERLSLDNHTLVLVPKVSLSFRLASEVR